MIERNAQREGHEAAERRHGLFTDLYQLTMAAGYFANGLAEREAVFHLYFRRHPFGGALAVACGLSAVADLLAGWGFSSSDLEYLESLTGRDGGKLFGHDFLDALAELRFTGDLDAVAEGTVVFADEPLLRIRAPLWQGQLLETPLLTLMNFQTLIATKAARIRLAAGRDSVLDFGLRRAQGVDGGLAASRAAFVGGLDGTSNVEAGRRWGIPVRGTHAHSWVMAFPGEPEAFASYAQALPNNCIFLVDTYDTHQGIRNAILAGGMLRRAGHEMIGIRLDSGDLAALSRDARRMLDEAGFPEAAIVASNNLDEHRIAELKARGSEITIWGVGTRLATGHSDGALGGVYKMSALSAPNGGWQPKVKLSQDPGKSSSPGRQQIRRFRAPDGEMVGDLIYDEDTGLESPPSGRRRDGTVVAIPESASGEDLLAPVFRQGRRVGELPGVDTARQKTLEQLDALPSDVLALRDPGTYAVGLERRLYELKERLTAQIRAATRSRLGDRSEP